MVSPVTNHLGVAYAIQLWAHIQDGFQVAFFQPWKIDANGPFTDDLLSEFPFQMVVFDSKLLFIAQRLISKKIFIKLNQDPVVYKSQIQMVL